MAENHGNNLPATRGPVDRAALERVLARAAELQSSDTNEVEQFTEQQLVELGNEVGLSPVHIRQALAEERTRIAIPQNAGFLTEFFGPTHIEARRMVRGPVASVLQRLDRWMDKEECLQQKRRLQDRMTWEARRDFLGSIKRGFNVGGRGYALSSAYEVGATITPVDDNNVLVSLTADFGTARRRAVGGSVATAGALGVVAALTVVVVWTVGVPLLVAGGAGAVLAGAGAGSTMMFARGNRDLMARGQLALEQALDKIEQSPEPSQSVIGGLIDAAVRDLRV